MRGFVGNCEQGSTTSQDVEIIFRGGDSEVQGRLSSNYLLVTDLGQVTELT